MNNFVKMMKMKKLNFLSFIFAGLLLAGSFTAVKAQNEMPPPDAPNQKFDAPQRPKLMAQLGLTQEQIRQIRQINQEKKPQIREAQERLREANRNLDQAIYADAANDAEIQTRLKELQSAHAEVIKIKSATELAVRKILTPEQLAKFRDVRRQFMERKADFQNRRKNRRNNAPFRPMNNRQRPPRQNN
ncbi:MAG: periplasmic heavy metal sensor [Acidobacteria bacterium]|jgi:Spy/CpxP family protein refolding chaperone|nr:periplasmic heavy metal sensor [Acidobacteriota bacterium]